MKSVSSKFSRVKSKMGSTVSSSSSGCCCGGGVDDKKDSSKGVGK